MRVGIVDYGMGNVFSVAHACRTMAIEPVLASRPVELAGVHGLIIPGVGAMPDAVETLARTGLDASIRELAGSGIPILGICLGFQLLMERGTEFGEHEGLGLMPGSVLPLPAVVDEPRLPIPNVGWRRVTVRAEKPKAGPFGPLSTGHDLYFVHSYYVRPSDPAMVVAETEFGAMRYCAAAVHGKVFGCQFHPERSGVVGLRVIKAFASFLAQTNGAESFL